MPNAHAGPDGIALGPDGNVWFSESDGDKIGRITPDGRIVEFGRGITPGSKPLSLVARSGALWFSESGGGRIGRITMSGEVSEYPLPRPDSGPRAMALHPDGSIWFVETGANAIGRMAPDGSVVEFEVPTPQRFRTRNRGDRRWRHMVYRKFREQNWALRCRRQPRRGIRYSDAEKRRAVHSRDG